MTMRPDYDGGSYAAYETDLTRRLLPQTREAAHAKRMADMKALAAQYPVVTCAAGKLIPNPPGRIARLLKLAETRGEQSEEFIHMIYRLHHAWSHYARTNQRRGVPVTGLRIFAEQVLLIREMAGER